MRLYFNLVDGNQVILDETGVEVPSQEAARAEGLNAIRELRAEDEGIDWGAWCLNIVDGSGRVFFSLPLGDLTPRSRSRMNLLRHTRVDDDPPRTRAAVTPAL